MLERYVAQVRLLVSVLPDIAQETAFALTGGTAINLFCRNLPRLSVDIDLTWLPIADRRSSLKEIDDALDRIVRAVRRRNPRIDARRVVGGGGGDTRIAVRSGRARVRIEVSPVTRGAVHPPRSMVVSERVTEQFGFVEANVLALEDLYDEEFAGMTREAVSLGALAETARQLHADIRSRLQGDIAAFLLSLHDAEPDFGLIGLPTAAELPAVRWKLVNLERLKLANPDL